MRTSSRVACTVSSHLLCGASSVSGAPASLCFSERAVKMTSASSIGRSPFLCMASTLACSSESATVTALLSRSGLRTKARFQLSGPATVAVFRENAIMFHCWGNAVGAERGSGTPLVAHSATADGSSSGLTPSPSSKPPTEEYEVDVRDGDLLLLLSHARSVAQSADAVRSAHLLLNSNVEDVAEELLAQLEEETVPCTSVVALVGAMESPCAQPPMSNRDIALEPPACSSSAPKVVAGL